MKKLIRAVDLYCGAGGSSTGLYRAAKKLGFHVDLTAINHWKFAIATHRANHPEAKHYETSINQVDPREVVPGGHLDLLWASPECVHFSVARGGKPVKPQSRASGWHVLHWAETLTIDNIIIENVKEYRTWGPLKRVLRLNKKTGKNERVWVPDPKRKGETYRALLAALRSLNYQVEERIINAADYGDPTTRERLFVIARRGRRKVSWPEPTHAPTTQNGRLFGSRKRWRAAREIIDWNIPGQSIFARKKPLATKTLERIFTGLEKFGGRELQPFLVILRNHGTATSVDEPIPTLTAGGKHVALAQPKPFLLPHQLFDLTKADSIDEPLRTVRAHPHNQSVLVEPFIVTSGGPRNTGPRSVMDPIGTLLTREHRALVEPYLTRFNGDHEGKQDGAKRVQSVDAPVGTLDTSNRYGLAEPFLLQLTHGGRVYDPADPMPTVTGAHRGETGVVNPFVMKVTHTQAESAPVRSADQPLSTITTAKGGEHAVVSPYLTKYYGSGDSVVPVSEPVPTVTTKDRFALVMPVVNGYALDIRFRMLQPKELASAMGFPDGYEFEGNREAVVKQIGNAVCVNTAQALCEAVLA